ncbi:hypothetical protein [Ideonella sp. YS5]|uniref:hypothetical protein n=1 Tax=Ideonella sp. YS5 TaxID=3453714 RepID=UPI003EEB2F2C
MNGPLTVHIARLVLDEAVLAGLKLDGRGRAALQAALQGELAARLAVTGLGSLSVGGAVERLRASDLRLTSGFDAAGLGQSLGTHVAGALQTEPRR